MSTKKNRRNWLKAGGGLGAMLLLNKYSKAAVLTPPQTEGPFYPIADQQSKNWDLTQVEGRNQVANGDPVIIMGQVVDVNDQPMSGAVVDMWQACYTGKYAHPGDPNPAQLDPNFQYFARFVTDNEGKFKAKTIIPGSYEVSATWERPPHIHFRVDAWGKDTLTTQMYFKDNPLNAADQILNAIAQPARDSVIVDFSQQMDELGTPMGNFIICVT